MDVTWNIMSYAVNSVTIVFWLHLYSLCINPWFLPTLEKNILLFSSLAAQPAGGFSAVREWEGSVHLSELVCWKRLPVVLYWEVAKSHETEH